MKRERGAGDDEGDAKGSSSSNSSRRRRLTLLSGGSVVDMVISATDWRELFEVPASAGGGLLGEAHVHARTVRNRLVRVAHPDRATDAGSAQRHTRATAHLNILWEQALRHFGESAGGSGVGGDQGGGVAARELAAGRGAGIIAQQPPALLGGPPSERRPPVVEPGGALAILRGACALTNGVPSMLERPELGLYVGFGNLDTLRGCRFLPMATNRCVSQDVVAQRVAQNLARLRERGAYHSFGQISLVAVEEPPTEQYCVEADGRRLGRFYVLDGQHRLTVMGELARERPNVPIWFELSVKVVNSKADANEALLHMQHCYHADPKCFFCHDDEAEVASRTLDLAKIAWAGAFCAASAARSAFARPPRPTIRPRLDDGLFYDVLRDTRLLTEVIRQTTLADGTELTPRARPQVLFDALQAVNSAIRDGGPPRAVAPRTFTACQEKHAGCFLGLYRRDDIGAKIMAGLKEKRVVPAEADCLLDAD